MSEYDPPERLGDPLPALAHALDVIDALLRWAEAGRDLHEAPDTGDHLPSLAEYASDFSGVTRAMLDAELAYRDIPAAALRDEQYRRYELERLHRELFGDES